MMWTILFVLCVAISAVRCDSTVGVEQYASMPENPGETDSYMIKTYILDSPLYRFKENGTATQAHIVMNLPADQQSQAWTTTIQVRIFRREGDAYRLTASMYSPTQYYNYADSSKVLAFNDPLDVIEGDILGFTVYQSINPIAYDSSSSGEVCVDSDDKVYMYNNNVYLGSSYSKYAADGQKCIKWGIGVTFVPAPICGDYLQYGCTCLTATEDVNYLENNNYPYQYGPNENDCWLIRATNPDHVIELELDELDVDGNKADWTYWGTRSLTCGTDGMYFYDGYEHAWRYVDNNYEENVITCWTGHKSDVDSTVRSTGEFMYVTWTSDYTIGGTWRFKYRSVDPNAHSAGLGTGAIVGIVIGCLVLIVIIIVIACCCCGKSKKTTPAGSGAAGGVVGYYPKNNVGGLPPPQAANNPQANSNQAPKNQAPPPRMNQQPQGHPPMYPQQQPLQYPAPPGGPALPHQGPPPGYPGAQQYPPGPPAGPPAGDLAYPPQQPPAPSGPAPSGPAPSGPAPLNPSAPLPPIHGPFVMPAAPPHDQLYSQPN